jgi:hypothetical protein
VNTNYFVKDNLCAKAIEEFKESSSVREWLQVNRSLYLSVTYQPPGLPRIIDCNIGDERFENIRMFGDLYERRTMSLKASEGFAE